MGTQSSGCVACIFQRMHILWAVPSSKPNVRAMSFLDRTAEVLVPFTSVLDESALMLGVLRFLSNVCEDSSLAGYDAVSIDKWLPTFRLSLLSASPRPLPSKTNKTGIVMYTQLRAIGVTSRVC